MEQKEPAFGPMVEVCKAHGIKRSWAFKLASQGLIETFLIGNKRFVTLASVRSLPQRLGSQSGVTA